MPASAASECRLGHALLRLHPLQSRGCPVHRQDEESPTAYGSASKGVERVRRATQDQEARPLRVLQIAQGGSQAREAIETLEANAKNCTDRVAKSFVEEPGAVTVFYAMRDPSLRFAQGRRRQSCLAHPISTRRTIPFCRDLLRLRPELDRPAAGDVADAEPRLVPPAE
jgi:hypothetical protein